MDMNNLRVDSHVAQKNRRHKLRFNQNSGDLNNNQHHHHQQQQTHFNPNVLPSEMIPSIPRNPNLLLPHQNHVFVSHNNNQDSLPYTQDFNTWKPVVSSQQELATDHWNNNNNASVSYNGYHHHQDTHNFNSSPFYHNTLQQDQHHVTLAIPPQGLSLSLSSVPHLKDDQPMLQSGQNPLKSDLLLNPDSKSLMGVSPFAHRNTGPLGPFTGYATILKNSKYIKPAQELLNVSCEVGYNNQELGHDGYSHKILEEEMRRVCDGSSVASYGESSEHVSGLNISSGGESIRPEFHRKKARLLYMLEEVCY